MSAARRKSVHNRSEAACPKTAYDRSGARFGPLKVPQPSHTTQDRHQPGGPKPHSPTTRHPAAPTPESPHGTPIPPGQNTHAPLLLTPPLPRPVCPSSPDSTPLPTLRADGAASPVPTSTSLPLSFRCAAGPRRRHDPPNLHRSSSHLQPRIIPPYAIQRRLPPRLDPRPTTASMEPIAANTPMISRR